MYDKTPDGKEYEDDGDDLHAQEVGRRRSAEAARAGSDPGSRSFQGVRVKRQAPTPTVAPWHFLYFLPEPHGQGSLRPDLLGADRLRSRRSG